MATMPAIPVKPNTKIQPDKLKIDGDKAPCREALIAALLFTVPSNVLMVMVINCPTG